MADTNEFRQLLLESKGELERRLAAIKLDVRNEVNPVSKDSGEQSIERENDDVIDALGNSAEAELLLISSALSRIESGEYFNCQACGEPIGVDRLRSVPYTALCIKCSERQENI